MQAISSKEQGLSLVNFTGRFVSVSVVPVGLIELIKREAAVITLAGSHGWILPA